MSQGRFHEEGVTYMYELDIDVRDSWVWHSAQTEHLPDEDSEGPNVALVVDHPGLQDLRSHPAYREAGADTGQILHRGVERPGETKVRHLGHRLVFLEENVPGGQITVDNLILLKELHPPADLVAVLQESLTGISSDQVQFSPEDVVLILESFTVLMEKTLQISL